MNKFIFEDEEKEEKLPGGQDIEKNLSSTETKTDEVKTDETKSDKNSNEAKSDEKSDETKLDEKSNEAKSDETKSDEAKSDETKSDETKSDEKSDETKLDEKSDEKSDEAKSDEVKSDETKSNETKTDEAKSDEVKSDAAKSDETDFYTSSLNALKELGFSQNKNDNSFEKLINNKYLIKIHGLEKQVNESSYMNTFYKIICEAKNGIQVELEIIDKESNVKKVGKSIFNGNKKDIIKVIKQQIYDKFLRNRSGTNEIENNKKLISNALQKLDNDELNAFEFFYGDKLKQFLKN